MQLRLGLNGEICSLKEERVPKTKGQTTWDGRTKEDPNFLMKSNLLQKQTCIVLYGGCMND